MELSEASILGVVGVMGLNQLVMRVHALRGSPWAFWPLQVANLAVGSGLILVGLPGFQNVPIVSWMIALIFFFRVVMNNNQRQEWLQEQQKGDSAEEKAVKAAFLEALRKGEGKQ